MSYCPKCHTLQAGLESACKACQSELRTPQADDKILLVADKERELMGLLSALSSQDVAFELETKKISISSYKSMSGGNIAKVLVPYRCYGYAREIAKAQGFHFAEEVTVKPLDETARAVYHPEAPENASTVGTKSDQKQQEEMSPGKKNLGRLLLFLSVIAVIAGVVFFSDAIIGFIKGLFG